MDIDWDVEIGGDAPVIEAQWPGYIDLHTHPERVEEIAESGLMPPLGDLLLALNSEKSPVWTSKCDVWQPGPKTIACYVDMIPREAHLSSDWKALEGFCRTLVQKMASNSLHLSSHKQGMSHSFVVADGAAENTTITLVVRRALIGCYEGFGITAYFSAAGSPSGDAESAMRTVMGDFSDAIALESSLG